MGNNGFKTKKSLGQNFLQDAQVLEAIAAASGAGPADTVVEIGPGLGALTDYLAECAGRVVAVELDDRLIPILRTKFALHPNVEIVHEDILKFDWSSLESRGDAEQNSAADDETPRGGGKGGTRPSSLSCDGKGGCLADRTPTGSLRIVGNLPYYITTPILLGILEQDVPAANLTVMVQKEVADRIVARPGGKDYGVLSISLQYYCSCRKALDVPAECFDPVPKVDSAVVVLERKPERPLSGKEEENFFALVKTAFVQRRKTLPNCLAGYKGLDKGKIENILVKQGIDPKLRPENLSVEDYITLSKEIENA